MATPQLDPFSDQFRPFKGAYLTAMQVFRDLQQATAGHIFQVNVRHEHRVDGRPLEALGGSQPMAVSNNVGELAALLGACEVAR